VVVVKGEYLTTIFVTLVDCATTIESMFLFVIFLSHCCHLTVAPCGYNSYACDKRMSYKTPMIVSILDWRLGCMKYIFMIMIFSYVIIYNVAYNCGYLVTELPVGHVRFQLQQPTVKNNATGAPCDPTKNNCDDNFTPVADLPYCKQNPESTSTHPCTYWDANQDVYSKNVCV